MSTQAISTHTIHAITELMERVGLSEADITERFILGSGSGGQKVNKTASAVQLKHEPTGLMVKEQSSRSRENNRWLARRNLANKILEQIHGEQSKRQQAQEKIRRQKRRRSRRQKNRMLDDKHKHAEKKASRRSPSCD